MAKQHNAVCTVCGKAYRRPPSRLENSRFCTTTCRNVAGELPKEELARLYYDERLSMQQIATQYGCGLHKVAYWMDRHGLERRNASEATYLQRNPEGDPFSIKEPETDEEKELFVLGIGLYMGEGTKKGSQVALANTNPSILRIFLSFLYTICGVDKSQVRACLNIFDDCDVDEALLWWSSELGLELDQFCKSTIRKNKGGTYKKKSVHGTLSVRVCNTKLLAHFRDWCEMYNKKFDSHMTK